MPDPAPFWWAVPLVGLAGAAVATASVLANRHLIRMRATLDLIERTGSNEHYLKLRANFRRLDANSGDPAFFSRITHPTEDVDKALRREIVAYINHYELVAIGCDKGILDEGFYRSWMRSHLVRDWTLAQPLVQAARTNPADPVPGAYVGFEGMASRFRAAGIAPWFRRGAAPAGRTRPR